jgi:hypothetical protein
MQQMPGSPQEEGEGQRQRLAGFSARDPRTKNAPTTRTVTVGRARVNVNWLFRRGQLQRTPFEIRRLARPEQTRALPSAESPVADGHRSLVADLWQANSRFGSAGVPAFAGRVMTSRSKGCRPIGSVRTSDPPSSNELGGLG